MNRAALAARARRLARQRAVRGPAETRMSPMGQLLAARSLGGVGTTRAKIAINEQTAMQIAAVFSAVRILAGIRATLPLRVFEDAQGQDPEVRLHPTRDLLGDRGGSPNPYQTPAVLQETREAHRAIWGNTYCELVLGVDGDVVAIVPHHPTAVLPWIDTEDCDLHGFCRLKYHVTDQRGTRTLPASQMLHVPNLGFDGIIGRSTLSLAGESMGIAIAQDRMAATFYGNANRPFMIVESPEFLDDEQFARLDREINEEYRGDDAFGSLLLEGGAKANFATMSFSDAQFLDMKRHTSREINCGFFGLPPHLSGDLENAHYDNLDEQDRALVLYTLAPILVRDEQEIDRKLLSRDDRRRGLYVKYDTDQLLAGDMKSRYEAHRMALMSGWRTINEVRAVEELGPLPGGDELARPQAIYGKPATPAADGAQRGAAESRDTAGSQALRELTAAVLNAFQRHEIMQLERLAGRADFAARARTFYAVHAAKVTARLQSVPGAAARLATHFERRLALVDRIAADPSPAAAAQACAAGWVGDPARLAAEMTTHTSEGQHADT